MSELPYANRPVRVGVQLQPQHANIWHGFGSVETLARKNLILDEWCAKVGRDPGEIERSTSARSGPEGLGEQLVAIGERLITIGTDGSSGFDLALTRDWLHFRDDQNADLSERG